MPQLIDPSSGLYRDISDMAFVDGLLRSKDTKSRWDTIDMVIAWYARKYATEPDSYTGMTWEQYIENNKRIRASLYDKKLGRGKEKIGRFIISMPDRIALIINKLYPDIFSQGMKDQQKYFREFAERYGVFKLPEKI
jgi:hypothetical protein